MHWLAHSHVQAVFGSIHPLQLLKVFPSITDVDESGCRWNGGVRHNDHDICVGGKDVDEGRKVGVPHLHALERGRKFTTAEFELFDNVTDLLKPVSVPLLFALIVGNHQEGGSLKQKNFICLYDLRKIS